MPRTTGKPVEVAVAKASRSQPKATRGSGVQTVYTLLKQDILEMSLAPGSVLDEVSLSQRFAMSRTPIREALVRLAGDGLVTTLPNRNTIVSTIDFAELPIYFESLTLMYRVTTRAAAVRHKPADLAAMRHHQDDFADAVRQKDAPRMIASNREFHVAIAEAGGNRYYTAFFARLLDEGRRILRLYYASFDDRLPIRYVKEHERMIAAIAERNVGLCDRLATEHAAQIVKQIQSFLDRGLSREIELPPVAALAVAS